MPEYVPSTVFFFGHIFHKRSSKTGAKSVDGMVFGCRPCDKRRKPSLSCETNGECILLWLILETLIRKIQKYDTFFFLQCIEKFYPLLACKVETCGVMTPNL